MLLACLCTYYNLVTQRPPPHSFDCTAHTPVCHPIPIHPIHYPDRFTGEGQREREKASRHPGNTSIQRPPGKEEDRGDSTHAQCCASVLVVAVAVAVAIQHPSTHPPLTTTAKRKEARRRRRRRRRQVIGSTLILTPTTAPTTSTHTSSYTVHSLRAALSDPPVHPSSHPLPPVHQPLPDQTAKHRPLTIHQPW